MKWLVGNLLVGSWDRAFRELNPKRSHFVQNNTFIEKFVKTTDSSPYQIKESAIYIEFKMTLKAFAPFILGVLYPLSVFKEPASQEEKNNEINKAKTEAGKAEKEETKDEISNLEKDKTFPEQTEQLPQQKRSSHDNPQDRASETAGELSGIKIADIMQQALLWKEPQDTITQAFTEMKEKEVNYAIIGDDKKVFGIVSRGDISAAMSPFLKEKLSRYRRPLDEATLQTPLHWVMSKPLVTIEYKGTLSQAIDKMYSSKKLCLVVTDEKQKVCGTITALDIFGAILKTPQIKT